MICIRFLIFVSYKIGLQVPGPACKKIPEWTTGDNVYTPPFRKWNCFDPAQLGHTQTVMQDIAQSDGPAQHAMAPASAAAKFDDLRNPARKHQICPKSAPGAAAIAFPVFVKMYKARRVFYYSKYQLQVNSLAPLHF